MIVGDENSESVLHQLVIDRVRHFRTFKTPSLMECIDEITLCNKGKAISSVVYTLDSFSPFLHIFDSTGNQLEFHGYSNDDNKIRIDFPANNAMSEDEYRTIRIEYIKEVEPAAFKNILIEIPLHETASVYVFLQECENYDFSTILYGVLDETYLFSWNKIPGDDNGKLIDFLMRKFSIEWINEEQIKKSDDGKIIRATNEIKDLSLTLDDEKHNVSLKIDDGRTDEFIVKTEDGVLNIYAVNYDLDKSSEMTVYKNDSFWHITSKAVQNNSGTLHIILNHKIAKTLSLWIIMGLIFGSISAYFIWRSYHFNPLNAVGITTYAGFIISYLFIIKGWLFSKNMDKKLIQYDFLYRSLISILFIEITGILVHYNLIFSR